MRTTVDIPDSLYRRLKSRAAVRGCSVEQLIVRGVKAELKAQSAQWMKSRTTLPLIKSKWPGCLKVTNKAINEVILP